MFLAIFAALGMAYASSSSLNMRQSSNLSDFSQARLEAESALAYYNYTLAKVGVAKGKSGQALLDDLADRLADNLNGKSHFNGVGVTYSNGTITIPPASLGAGRSFGAAITLAGTNTVHLRLTGQADGVSRAIGLNLTTKAGNNFVMSCGIASKSAIKLTGNASVAGANNSAEGSILSATYSTTNAVTITGNCAIQGDIYASNPDAAVSMTGNVSVGGESSNSAAVKDHIHIGIGAVDFPEVDPTVFEPYATNIIDSHTSTNGNKTFTNIRIKAGTNPTFSGNITIKGVVFVEQPNVVTFSGNTNMTGVLVTQDAGDNTYTTNKIKFTGNMTSKGVEQLPDTAEFHELRELKGSFILAPGFGVSFAGNFGTVNGTMAADAFTFVGNSGGTVKGGIINYSDSDFTLTGNSRVVIDRNGMPDTPAGFNIPAGLATDASSYVEY